MDKQMQAFALGGLKDEGGEIDEESGNRVPIGGTKEGVRDDIPANVSEGEFIFPADVVRYHGLDKMMALRQEAKIGLRKMESMGQMGNSDEATMPDDLPFEMADLIVVGGQGEPMEFANGGFVPSYAPGGLTTSSGTVDLDIADVPMMGDSSTGVGYTPINYDDYMKPPVVIMKEYRNANGDSIIITSVNGVATTEIPEGYTLYTPPSSAAPSNTQAAINTVNRRSYRPTGDDEGPEPQVEQPAPDYKNMNDNEFFSYMSEQNSFGAKAGNALATAISLMIPVPGVAILTQVAMRNHKNKLMDNMKSRIDRMVDGPAKTAALANFKEYGGETEPKKKGVLLTNITNFVNGFAGDVGKLFGISPEEAAKATQQAAITEVSGAVIGDGRTSPLDGRTPSAVQVEGMGSPLSPVVAPATAATTAPSLNTMDALGEPAGNIQTPTSTKDKSLTSRNPVPLTSPLRAGPPQAAPLPTKSSPSAPFDTKTFGGVGPVASFKSSYPDGTPAPNTLLNYITQEGYNPTSSLGFDPAPKDIGYDEAGVSKQPPNYAFIPKSEPVINPVSAQEAINQQDALTDAGLIANEVLARPDEPFLDAAARYARQGFDTFIAGDKNRGYFNPVNEQIDAAVAGAQDTITSAAVPSQPKPYDFSGIPSGGYDEVQMQDPRATQQFGNDNYIDPNVVPSNEQSLYTGASNVVPSNEQSLYTGASGEGYGIGQVDPRLAAAVQTQQALNIPTATQTQQAIPTGRGINMTVPALKETPAQRRATEAAAQRTRIQTRNKEIASATALIPEAIKNSSYYNDQVKRGYTGSTTGGYAVGKISGSDGDLSGVVQKADGKVQKLRDVQGYEGLKGTQRGGMTVYKDAEGIEYVKSTFGKKTKLDGSKYTGSGSGSSGGTGGSASAGRGNTSSGRTVAQIQADINKELDFGRKEFTSKANALVAEREAAKKAAKSSSSGGGSSSSSSTTSSSSSNQSGTGFFRGKDESGNTGSDSSKGGYSCYVATALSEKGYWSHTQKIKLIKWCMEAKPEGKLDTILWRNGYCIFGKNIIAPKVDNKIIQWLSNGFYHATISNKKTLQAILGKLFFIIPSYTIGIWKALRGSLVDIERT